MRALRHFLLAVQFFTRVPVTGRLADWVGFSPAMLRASAAHFPAVGIAVGAVAAGVGVGLATLLGDGPFVPLIAAVAGTIATVLLTGALHEDGLADVVDGLGGTQDRVRALAIMKDSRIGAFGALALVLAIGFKVSLLAHLLAADLRAAGVALVLAHCVSRAWPLLVIRLLPYVGEADGTRAKPLADTIGTRALAAGFAWTALAVAAAGWMQGAGFVASAVAASALAAGVLARWLHRRLGGFTGDGLGATQQTAEIACYLGLALWLAR